MKKSIFIILAICCILSSCNTKKVIEQHPINKAEITLPEKLAQAQLNAYNGHDLEAFLEPYAEDVKVYEFPNTLRFQGKETMRKQYQFIENNPDLHCKLVNRIVEGNTVIDHENVTVSKNRPFIKAIAIYKIKDGKIAEVYFIQ